MTKKETNPPSRAVEYIKPKTINVYVHNPKKTSVHDGSGITFKTFETPAVLLANLKTASTDDSIGIVVVSMEENPQKAAEDLTPVRDRFPDMCILLATTHSSGVLDELKGGKIFDNITEPGNLTETENADDGSPPGSKMNHFAYHHQATWKGHHLPQLLG